MKNERFYALDALRLGAALLVVLYHWVRGVPAEVKDSALYPMRLTWQGGYLGVGMFFLISGLVILMSADGRNARDFIVARLVRLYPAFWVCCTITYLACMNTKYSTDQNGYIVSMTMFPGAFGHQAVDGVYWTLAVEARFYLMIAALLALGRLHQLPAVMWAWLALGFMPFSDYPIRAAFALDWAPYFAGGCACYLLRFGHTFGRWSLWSVSLGIALHGAVGKGAEHARQYGIADESAMLMAAVAGMFALILAVGLGWLRLPRSRVVIAMGMMSYPLYLLHSLLGRKALGLYATDWLSFVSVVAGMLFLSWAVAAVIEPRGQALLRRLLLVRPGRRREIGRAVVDSRDADAEFVNPDSAGQRSRSTILISDRQLR